MCSCIPWGAYTLKRVFFILRHTTSSVLAGLFGTGCLGIKHWHGYRWSHNPIQYSLFPNEKNAVEKMDFLHLNMSEIEDWSKLSWKYKNKTKQNKKESNNKIAISYLYTEVMKTRVRTKFLRFVKNVSWQKLAN